VKDEIECFYSLLILLANKLERLYMTSLVNILQTRTRAPLLNPL
jgi:hypothetical protein